MASSAVHAIRAPAAVRASLWSQQRFFAEAGTCGTGKGSLYALRPPARDAEEVASAPRPGVTVLPTRRYSGLQKRVFQLYRAFVRGVRQKPAEQRPALMDAIRSEFRKGALQPKTDITTIEYMLRYGKRQLEVLKSPNMTGVARVSTQQQS
jgi:succinate dehydrogenase assembly factor 1